MVLLRAEPEGYIRIFVDEGEAVRSLIVELQASMLKPIPDPGRDPNEHLNAYIGRLLAAFP